MPDRLPRTPAAGRGIPRRRLLVGGAAALAALPAVLSGCVPAPVAAPAPSAAVPPTSAPPPSTPTASPAPTAPPTTADRPVTPAPPTRLTIAELGLDEELIDLGLAPDATLEVPADPDRVGWFAGGGRPGGPGPTVLVGHVDSRTGPAVFARLTELRPGSRVEVTAADGRRTRYVITAVADVAKNTFPTEAVFGATPGDELRLITCTGYYDRRVGSHRENRVVSGVAGT